ncbi:MAG TPA: diguanylate cyclase [Burkholderiales bacterium]|nr:diguanylate cyclase [Burkholderiales bacterium]
MVKAAAAVSAAFLKADAWFFRLTFALIRAAKLMTVTKSPRLTDYILVPLLYFLGAKLGATYTVMPEGMVILWPPNSVLLTALLLFQGRGFLPFAALSIGAEVIADLPAFTLTEALLFGVTNVLEATIAFVLLTRWRFHPRLDTLRDVPKFILAGPVIAALVAACFGATIYSLFRGSETNYVEFLLIWWVGDALGLMIFTPVLLSFWPIRRESSRARLRAADVLVSLGAVATLVIVSMGQDGMLHDVHVGPMLLLPFLLFMAARFELRWTAFAVAVAALSAVVLTTTGANPFGPLPPRNAVIEAQEFIFLMSVMALGLSVLMSGLRNKQIELEDSNHRLNELNRQLDASVIVRTAELTAANEQLTRLAVTDPLTNVLNRRGFFDLADREIERARRSGMPLALIMFDVDHFKAINDRHGHDAGDIVLSRVTTVITNAIRTTDTLARYGGEEFMVLAPDTGHADACMLAERMRRELQACEVPLNSDVVRVTASFGVALRDGDQNLDMLVKQADEMVYAAKKSGRNCVVVTPPPKASIRQSTAP